jgi:hypothetical protein
MNKRRIGLAALFAAIGVAEAAALNYFFSPAYIWFYYVAFGLLWWPLAALLPPGRRPVVFSLAGSLMTAAFLAAVSMQNTPDNPWFLYALYPLAWWPVSVYFSRRRKFRGLSLAGCALTVAYFAALNFILTPSHPWFLYACWPIVWWPVAMHLGKKAGTLAFACVCSALTIAYYAALNVFVSPGFPWAICPAFAVLWWPISMYFAKKRQWVGYSFAGSALTVAFLFVLNLVSSPAHLWAVYPSAAIPWWPVSVFFAKRRAWLAYSVAGAALVAGGSILVNLIASPGTPWAFYPIFAVLWWPMSVLFARLKNGLGYSVAATALTSAFLLTINLLYSPGVLWVVFPVFAVMWWPLSIYFFKYRKLNAS